MNVKLDAKTINIHVGKMIAKYRQASGFTQEQVAEILEIGNETVSRMERGLIMPNVLRLMELAEIFNCSTADLLDNNLRIQDQNAKILDLLSRLNSDDQILVLGIVEQLTQRLTKNEIVSKNS